METSTTITLVSSDEVSFEVPREIAMGSAMISKMLEDIEEVKRQSVTLCNVTGLAIDEGTVLSKVLDYLTFHAEAEVKDEEKKPSRNEEEIKSFDNEYMKVDQSTLYDLILAANYLNIAPLLDLCCQTVAYIIKGKSPDEIRRTFNIKVDIFKEEEEEVRRENQWAFD